MNQRVFLTTYAKKSMSNLPDKVKEEFFKEFKNFHQKVKTEPEKFILPLESNKNENKTIMPDINKNENAAIYSLKLGSYNALLTIHDNMTIIHAVGKFSTD
ncbi:MAG: hypothetical protein JXQ82_06425 [Methanomicrobiaceae archaeon]|nr:hypothetical protein [Methanomicrobiaceae archaeon]